MVGGSDADVERAMPIFDTLRPPGAAEDGFVHAGPVGAGHFAKMVHNGIEYALMTAYAEGYEMLAAEDLIKDPQAVYQAWTNGTVVRSWLQQLLAKALKEDPELDGHHRLHRGFRRRPVDGRGGDPAARAGARHRGVAVRPVPVPPGRLADHEGGRRRCATSSVATPSSGSASPDRSGQISVRPPPGTDRTSGPGRGSTWTSSRAARCSSARTASARRISLKHCGIRRRWDRTASHRTRR